MSKDKNIERNKIVLKAIVESFIKDSDPVSSKFIKKYCRLDVSEATIRNDMQRLEDSGYIISPHTSAGRVPTQKAFREYIDVLTNYRDQEFIREQEDLAKDDFMHGNVDDILHNAVSILSKHTKEIAFATIPSKNKSFYLGISNLIRTPEFLKDAKLHTVIEVLEDSTNFIGKLSTLDISDQIKVYIGKENLLPEMQTASMIATKYYLHSKGEEGVIGILGPIRMNYPYNMAILDMIKSKISVYLLGDK